MGVIAKLKGELVDIIEWLDDSRTTLAWRFPRYQNEIKNGAQLIVREGQRAVFVYRGQLADEFGPGHYELTTENLPILSTLQGWKHGFDSPFRSEVYFINTRPVTEMRWGTPNPITIRDPEFKLVPVRANGLCVVRVADPAIFLRQVIGTDSNVDVDEVGELLRRVIAQAFADLIIKSGVGVLDLQGRVGEIAAQLRQLVAERVDDEYGLAIDDVILNVSLPEEITAAITRGVARGLEEQGFLDQVDDMQKFQQGRLGDALVTGAQNGGGVSDFRAPEWVWHSDSRSVTRSRAPRRRSRAWRRVHHRRCRRRVSMSSRMARPSDRTPSRRSRRRWRPARSPQRHWCGRRS